MQDKEKDGGLWISNSICQLKIGDGQKMLLAVIEYLENDDIGCFASDLYFSKKLGKSINTIQDRLRELEKLNMIERLNVDGKRYIKSTLGKLSLWETNFHSPILNNRHTDTEISVLHMPNNRCRNKEINKEIKNRESTFAFSFLKLNYNKRFVAWENKYKVQIKQYEKFILDYNDTVVIESIPFKVDELFNFLCKYAKGYIKYDSKYNRPTANNSSTSYTS